MRAVGTAAPVSPGTQGTQGHDNWTRALRERIERTVPAGQVLPDRQPVYVASWIYVFGVLTLAALVVVLVSGAMLAAGVADTSAESQAIGGSRTYDHNVVPSQLCQRFGRFLEPAVIGKSSVQNRRVGTIQKL